MDSLKENIKRLVEENGISMAKLARSTEIPPQTLNNWLSGQEPRSLSQVKRIADYFDVSLDELCFGIKPRLTKNIEQYSDEINAGVFEVVLRRVKK